ncbi:hypothetical protein [Streptomyces sp. NPDC051211]|uniref:hypothetical protein n=1 Tax=Streptomyces sp. NPDC051211 TaxID=3154643 RepID=UPI00344C89DA
MRKPSLSKSRCSRRIAIGMAGAALTGLVLAPQALAADQLKAPRPYVFNYDWNNHLSLGGGHFTVGGRVYVDVKLNSGATHFRKWVTARPGQRNPGGTFHIETNIPASCPGDKNGYARGYDQATDTWAVRLPVSICVRFD